MRVLLYVQHLLGSGHLQRIALIASELSARGAECWLVSGGVPVATINTDSFRLKQLPPLRVSDSSFSMLVDEAGEAVGEDYMARRQQILLDVAVKCQPQVVVVESWPFGRRKLRHELIAMMQLLHGRDKPPLTVCSIRDILQRGRKADRLQETVEHVLRWFDNVLVHADPNFVELEHSFELTEQIKSRLVYTGFVVRPAFESIHWQPLSDARVLVSAGGGAVGLALYQSAIDAARLAQNKHQWHLLIGRGITEQQKQKLDQQAPASVKIEWARSDFPDLLGRAAVSVSQAGYNTVMDLLNVGCPAVVVPFDADGETEQSDRAQRLHALGLAKVLSAEDLTGHSLLEAVNSRHLKASPDWSADFSGAVTSAQWLLHHAAAQV